MNSKRTWNNQTVAEEVEQEHIGIPIVGDLVQIVTDKLGLMLNTDLIGKSGLVIGIDDSMGVVRVLVHMGDRQLLMFPDMLEVIHGSECTLE